MNKAIHSTLLLLTTIACGQGGSDITDDSTPITVNEGTPSVTENAAFAVLEDLDITFAEGLAHDETSMSPFAVPLKLDVYYPDTELGNRPVFMFIHGGGFTGGTKTKPEIIEMAKYYASRGWVFASVDYRTTEELCDSERMPQCEGRLLTMAQDNPNNILEFYRGSPCVLGWLG